MPTPVSLARQCLTPEAAVAFDEAVAVARRRGHVQTTSLHAVSALLSLPSSALRDACARARNIAYSPRLQFRALELCLSVSLERVPATQVNDDPPVSNSLMAAIKRSQANQRRQPENFHLYHQLSQQSSVACVKVELQHLLLSILDDPLVSKVFGEAGFRSSEIKLAILRPYPQLVRCSRRSKGPLFLCSLSDYSTSGRRGISFPWFIDGDENSRRIGEVLGRKQGKNPLLVGVCSSDALRSFSETVERGNDSILPLELSGLKLISIQNDVLRFISGNFDEGSINLRFEELGRIVEHCLGPGLILNFGDLKAITGDYPLAADSVKHLLCQLTKLINIHAGKLWLIGAAASYETYLKFIGKFPSIEKDLDLQPFPITSFKPALSESYPKSSLMESFVPFGGFFSTPSDLKIVTNGSYNPKSRCHLCNEKCEEEILGLSKGGFSGSEADESQYSLPSLLHMAEVGTNKGLDTKIGGDFLVLSAKFKEVQKKWDDICQQLHRNQVVWEATTFPTLVGFQLAQDKEKNEESKNSFPAFTYAKNGSLLPKLYCQTSGNRELELDGRRSLCSFSNSNSGEAGVKSPASTASLTIDLGLGMCSPHSSYHSKRTCKSCSIIPDLGNGNKSTTSIRVSSCSSSDCTGTLDARDMKALKRALSERVSWQNDAVSILSQAISCWRTSDKNQQRASSRGDIWLNFIGPDRVGKKKVAIAVAEILYGNGDHFIGVDLSPQDGTIGSNGCFYSRELKSRELNGYDEKYRGKTVVDFLADELSKIPLAVVFLENVDKSDLLVQNSLLQGIWSGKFSNSHGKEVSINNAIFITSSSFSEDKRNLFSVAETSKFSEERILRAKLRPMQITIGNAIIERRTSKNIETEPKDISNTLLVNKRKVGVVGKLSNRQETSEMAKKAQKTSNMFLDLNLPAFEKETEETEDGYSDNDQISEDSKAWFQDFCDRVDETVIFKPFDFKALEEKMTNQIKKNFHEIFGLECMLDIDGNVMEQILAAEYMSYGSREVEDWVEQVLSKGFTEARRRHSSLTTDSTVKLGCCEEDDDMLEEEASASGVWLPRRIIIS